MSLGDDLRHTARATPALLRVGFAGAVAYRSEFLVWVLTTNMPLVMLALWTAVAREAPVGRFGQRDFAAYFLAALLVRLVTGSWVVWELTMEVRSGALSARLLRPIHPFVYYAMENLAALPLRGLIALPITLASLAYVGRGHLAHDPVAWAILPLALAGAWAIVFCVGLCVGTLGLFWQSASAVFDVWLACGFVLSGYTIPLELFPPNLYAVVRWLPFRYTLAFPVEVALGMSPRGPMLAALGTQWAWAALFLFAALALWRAGMRRHAAVGG